MPLTAAARAEYPCDWPFLSWNIVMRRSGRRCECGDPNLPWDCGRGPAHHGPDGRCRNRHGQPRWRGKPWQRPVILSLIHLNHDPTSRDVTTMRASCEGCHLHEDQLQHAETRRRNREARLGLVPLFDVADVA